MAFLVGTVFVVGVLVAAVVAGNRTLRNADGSGSAIVDALANFTDVFEPSRARAARHLKDFENAGPATPVPDDDEDRPYRLVRGPDGRPRALRIRRPRG